MTCYCISGLGADQRIFSRLNLPGVTLHYLPWLLPQKDEPIGQYADRMKAWISVTHFIPDGGHLMVHNRPEAVGQGINAILTGLCPPAAGAAYTPKN